MFKRIKQFKKIWSLANKDEKYLDAIQKLSWENINNIPEVGNGKAKFIPFMTEKERDDYVYNQQPVWKKFNEKLKDIIKL